MTVRDSITRTGARTPGVEVDPTSKAAHDQALGPTQRGNTDVDECAKGGRKPNISRCMPGAGLNRLMCGKAPPYMPACQPYRGKPAVRNDREGRGNVGIIRSPVRASTLPDCGGREVTRVPTAKSLQSRVSLADSGHRHRVALWCWWLSRPALTRPMGRGASADVS
jgi:hypothetical protein